MFVNSCAHKNYLLWVFHICPLYLYVYIMLQVYDNITLDTRGFISQYYMLVIFRILRCLCFWLLTHSLSFHSNQWWLVEETVCLDFPEEHVFVAGRLFPSYIHTKFCLCCRLMVEQDQQHGQMGDSRQSSDRLFYSLTADHSAGMQGNPWTKLHSVSYAWICTIAVTRPLFIMVHIIILLLY